MSTGAKTCKFFENSRVDRCFYISAICNYLIINLLILLIGRPSGPQVKGSEKSEPFFMAYYVNILKSKKDGTYYKGSTADYCKRFEEHNAGLSKYTSYKIPWLLLYVEEHPDRHSALIREKKLKKCKADYFEWLARQSTNLLHNKLPPCHGHG